jgi:hypothetical protein
MMSDSDKEFQVEMERAESEQPDNTDGPATQDRRDYGILDQAGEPVRLTYFLILQTPDYSVTPTGILGGEDVPLIRYAGRGFWVTPPGLVRAKDVWDVRPAQGQRPFMLMVPSLATACLINDPSQRLPVTVVGWDGKEWLTDQGRALHVEAPMPKQRTIDDDWAA